ncbi:cation diffusion facilitator family transporter [Chlorobium phaeovibrioides]
MMGEGIIVLWVTMDANKKKKRVAFSSVLASALLTVLKLVAGLMTGSIGILSEAAHSLLDFGAAAMTWVAVGMSSKPADRKHHYGHAKVESITALVETGLLLLTSGWIISAATERLLGGEAEVEVTWYAIAVMLTSIVVDFSRARALSRVAKETNSTALEADALHFSSDILSSAVVLIGLFFVSNGIFWADAAAGIVVAVVVARAAFQLGKKTIDILTDAAPVGIAERAEELAKTVPGVIGIKKIRVKPTGPQVFIEMSVAVNRTLSVEKVRDICTAIEEKVHGAFPVADMTIHTHPVALTGESIAERVHVIGLNHGLHAHNIATNFNDGARHITFDVEVDQRLKIKEAHQAVTLLEDELRREFDGNPEICIHLDPLRCEERRTTPLPEEEEAALRKVIVDAAATIPAIADVHDITILKTEKEKRFITLHCSFQEDVLMEDVHELTSRLEGAIYQAIPLACRVIIHAEPLGG